MTDKKKIEELNEQELDKVTGGGTAEVSNTVGYRRRKGTANVRGIDKVISIEAGKGDI